MDRDTVTATVRVGGQLYTYTHSVDRFCSTNDAEQGARSELIQHLRQRRIAYTAADLDTVRNLWARDGMAITRAER